MKRFIIAFVFMLIGALSVNAQDIIVKKDGETVKCRVLKVSDETITYKKWSNLEGPDYTIKITNVLSINYENGDVDKFTTPQPEAIKQTETTSKNTIPDNSKKIHVEGSKFVYDYNGKYLTNAEVFRDVCQGPDYNFYKNLYPLQVNLTPWIVMTVIGGVTLPLSGWLIYTACTQQLSTMKEIGACFGAAIPPFLTYMGILGIVSCSKNRSRLNSIADSYNYRNRYASLNPSTPDWNLAFGVTHSGGVGLVLTF